MYYRRVFCVSAKFVKYVVDHIPEALAKALAPIIVSEKIIHLIEREITKEQREAAKTIWVQGGVGIELLFKHFVYRI